MGSLCQLAYCSAAVVFLFGPLRLDVGNRGPLSEPILG